MCKIKLICTYACARTCTCTCACTCTCTFTRYTVHTCTCTKRYIEHCRSPVPSPQAMERRNGMLNPCTCLLVSNFQQNSCSVKPSQHSCLQRSCCAGFALQLLCTCTLPVYMYMYMYMYTYRCACTCTCTCNYFVGSCGPTHPSHPMTSSIPSV